jgi:5-hydroxyisourate hydrolase-like protein (transthyretin family)
MLVQSARLVALLLAIVLTMAPRTAVGQAFRGRVTDVVTGAPAVGALVSLWRADSVDSTTRELRSVLTDGTGAYALVAPDAGPWFVMVRRIGSQPFRSPAITLGASETRLLDVALDPAAAVGSAIAVLDMINVTRATPCRREPGDGARIATLWGDARTALEATEVSTRDRLVARRLVRYVRELDPRTLDVESEVLQAFDSESGAGQPMFQSLAGDSLSQVGYWRQMNNRSTVFYGLDARALLSEAFVRDHCFGLVEGTDSRAGMLGLTFVPITERNRQYAPPEIRGAIWLDAGSSALEFVEFVWTRLPGQASTKDLGGEVHFARTDGGPWYVSSWRLRMPQDVIEIRGSGSQVTRVRRLGVVEEGGVVLDEAGDASRAPAHVSGEVTDNRRRPLAGAVVRVLGSSLRTVTGPDGRFALDSVPPGLQFIEADHESLEDLGVPVGQTQLLIDEGARRRIAIRAPTPEEITRRLCGDLADARDHATLRVLVTDSTTGRPAPGLPLRLQLVDTDRRPVFDLEDETNASGAIVFCGLPTGHALRLSRVGGTGETLGELTAERGTVVVRKFQLRAGRGVPE